MAQTSNRIFRSIVNADLGFPRRHPLSRSGVNFIQQLLRKRAEPRRAPGRTQGRGRDQAAPFLAPRALDPYRQLQAPVRAVRTGLAGVGGLDIVLRRVWDEKMAT
ncbi:unnamed protein product [Laminaria digitata]